MSSPAVIYVIGSEHGPQKIGVSRCPRRRLQQMQGLNPQPLRIAHLSEPLDLNAESVEAYVHWLLRDRQVSGEWFNIAAAEAKCAIASAILAVAGGAVAPSRVAGPGRKMLYPVRITLPLADGVTDRIDALVSDGETRLDIIREAIERELKRRERSARSAETKGD